MQDCISIGREKGFRDVTMTMGFIRRPPFHFSGKITMDTLKILIAVGIIACSQAQVLLAPRNPDDVGAAVTFNSQDGSGQYDFGYQEGHPSGSSFRRESGDALGNKVGTFGLRDADGRLRIVRYVADENGFRADVTSNEPGVAPVDPASATINKPAIVRAPVLPVAPVIAAPPPAAYVYPPPKPLPPPPAPYNYLYRNPPPIVAGPPPPAPVYYPPPPPPPVVAAPVAFPARVAAPAPVAYAAYPAVPPKGFGAYAAPPPPPPPPPPPLYSNLVGKGP